MATRGRLALPASFIAAVEHERKKQHLSGRALARKAGVSAPSVLRLRRGEASWETIERVAAALGVPVPVLIDPESPEGRFGRMKDTNPVEYKIIARLIGNADGNTPWRNGND